MWEDSNNDFLDDLANALDPFHVNDTLYGNGDGQTSFYEMMTAEILGDDDALYDDYGSKNDSSF